MFFKYHVFVDYTSKTIFKRILNTLKTKNYFFKVKTELKTKKAKVVCFYS